MSEIRKYPRIDIDQAVGVHAGDHYKVERGRQWSEGGMLFESSRDFALGQSVALTFNLSEDNLIRLDAQVAYVIKPIPGVKLVGVRFLNQSAEALKILSDYFAKNNDHRE